MFNGQSIFLNLGTEVLNIA